MNPIETAAALVETLRSEIVELDAVENPTDEQTARFDAALAEFKAAKAEHERLVARAAEVEAVRSLALQPTTIRESGFSAPQVNVKRSPFENLDSLRFSSPSEIKARALTAIEETDGTTAHMERATVLAQRDASIAHHILVTGSPAYRSAFTKFMERPADFASMLDDAERDAFRAAMSTTNANGGFLIPFLLDPTIVLTNSGTANSIRQIARVETGTSNVWNGITSAGVTAEWKSEGAAAADASPTVARPAITAYLADAYIFGSFEAFQDTDIAAQVPALVQDAKDRLEATAFTVGSGSGQPFGVVTSTTAVTASRVSATTGGAFTAVTDVYRLANAVPARHASSASWLANKTITNLIRSFDTSGGSAFLANLGMGQPTQLLGQPLYEASDMASTVTTGSNILLAGDFSQYLIYDRIGVSLEFIPNVFDQATGRPSGQRGFLAHWRVGADVLNANAFRVLRL